MRSLVFKDVFTVSRILKKMKIRPEIVDGISQEQFGAEVFFKFIENIGDAEEEVIAFIADLKGIKAKELANMDFEQVNNLIEEFKEMKGLKGFFTQVGKLMK